ncbi:hypothetical protein CAEBREN_16232 [Caenorhabditis brenneri]|uniref:F-box domain-containing protein n=1 Tax=Caenorhabditis brenneri TaxID=135651 RepID=G0NCS6_CAEBE|nr:hypothetical protein CAEBREN_16232 [Caenorhabditis brenneri]
MTIALRCLPLLVQYEVMHNMNLIDVFTLLATSKKSRLQTKYYFNRQKCVVEYIVDAELIHIHRNPSSKNYSPERDYVEMSSLPALEIPRGHAHLLELAVELFPKLTLNLDFPNKSYRATDFQNTMAYVRSLNVPIITVKVGPSNKINDDLMRCVLLSCTDVKNLTIRNFSHTRFHLSYQPVPPFKFDFIELKGAEWVTKDRLIDLFLGCKKVILGSFIRLSYSDLELVEICGNWLRAPAAQYLEIQSIETFSEGIGRLPGAVPVKGVTLDDEDRIEFAARKCYKMEKADGTPAIIYHHENCIVFRTDFENAVIGEGTEPVVDPVHPFVAAYPALFHPGGLNYYW